MSESEKPEDQVPAPDHAESTAVEEAPVATSDSEEGANASLKTPQYAQLSDTSTPHADASLQRFYDVEVTISAELGRVSLPIGEIVKLGEGSVIDLDRPISSPVEVVAQGVRIATGEVVVIDDCFAIRIKEIDSGITQN